MKGQRFSEMFPVGECALCKKPCEENAIFHLECAIAYEDLKRKKLKEDEKKVK